MKNKTENELMLEYIKRFHPLCMSIKKIKLSDHDSDNGYAFSYFIVESVFLASDMSIPINNYASTKEVTLKVEKKYFNNWVGEQQSVEIIEN